MKKKTVEYGKLTREKTPHMIGPPTKALHIDEELGPYMFPLVSVDFAECSSRFKRRLMFVYAEYSETENDQSLGLQFRLDNQGGYTLDKHSASEFKRFINEVELPTSPRPKSWKSKYLAIKRASIAEEDTQRIFDLRHAIHEKDRYFDKGYPVIGGSPLWIQSPGYPLDPDGKPMTFVGQVSATYFTDFAADYEIYLFYSSKHRRVTQIAQFS